MTTPTLSVTLPEWEGPLDLLLHVIRTHTLDILDIPIAFVTEQYLTYLDTMRSLNLDIAAEYLEMAATLVHIKSRMMLPSPPDEDEESDEEEGDPREELIRRLLEYQRYKEAAQQLSVQPQLGRDTFASNHVPEFEEDTGTMVELGLFDLTEAFRSILERSKPGLIHEVSLERITISERIGELTAVLPYGVLTPFYKIFPEEPSRYDVVITLLALLEMTRLRMTRLFQASAGGLVYVTLGGPQPTLTEPTRAQRNRGDDAIGKINGRGLRSRWKSTHPLPGRLMQKSRTLLLLRSLRQGLRKTHKISRTPTRSRPRPLGRPSPRRRSR